MKCQELAELLDLYVDGALADEARTRLDRHLLLCSECSFEVRALEQTRGLLREAYPTEAARPSFRERMAARLDDELSDVLKPARHAESTQWTLPGLQELR